MLAIFVALVMMSVWVNGFTLRGVFTLVYLLLNFLCFSYALKYSKNSPQKFKVFLVLAILMGLVGLAEISIFRGHWLYFIFGGLQYAYICGIFFSLAYFVRHRTEETRMLNTDMFLALSGVLKMSLLFFFFFALTHGIPDRMFIFQHHLLASYSIYFIGLFVSIFLSVLYFIRERKEGSWKKSKLFSLLLIVVLSFCLFQRLSW